MYLYVRRVHFFFNSGTVRSVLLTEFTAAATCCRSLCFLLLAIPSVTTEQNYFSGLQLTHKCLHFNLHEISLFCFSKSCHCFRQDIILASESALYADRIHEVFCIDHLWLKRGVYRAEREADSAAHTCRHSVIYKAKIA